MRDIKACKKNTGGLVEQNKEMKVSVKAAGPTRNINIYMHTWIWVESQGGELAILMVFQELM
jgi:hypothetical protein